jgi:hypothetical protein
MSRAAKNFCKPHLERAGAEIEASEIVEGLAMCGDCFRGKPILDSIEDVGGDGRTYGGRTTRDRTKRVHFVSDRTKARNRAAKLTGERSGTPEASTATAACRA